MAYTGSLTSGNEDNQNGMGGVRVPKAGKVPSLAGRGKMLVSKNPGSPGRLGKSSTLSESLSKLRGKGAA